MMEKLLPCPFCGSRAVPLKNFDFVWCGSTNCPLHGETIFTKKTWNTRPDSKPLSKLPATGPLTENMILEIIAADEAEERARNPYKYETYEDFKLDFKAHDFFSAALDPFRSAFNAARETKE